MDRPSVFLLFHIHHLADGEDDEKLLGVYSSREQADSRIETVYKTLPGFADGDGEFIVDEYQIDQDQWTEGYLTELPSRDRPIGQ